MSNKHNHSGNTAQAPAATDKAVQPTAEQRIAALEAELARKTAELAASQAETAQLRETRQPGRLSLNIGAKGAVTIRGMSKMGHTFYGSQLRRLLEPATVARILRYVDENTDHMAWKVNGVAMPPAKPLPNYGQEYVAGQKSIPSGKELTLDDAPTTPADRAAATIAERDARDAMQEAARADQTLHA